MAYARSKSRGLSLGAAIILLLIFVPAAGIGTVGVLWAAGAVDLPFLSRSKGLKPGEVLVPMSLGKIPAYTKLTRENVYMVPVQRERIQPEVILDAPNEIFGQVLDHDKRPDYPFTARDFLPKGTRAGMVAGIPAGKRSLTLAAEKISGIYGLRIGDHIDLLSSVPIDMTKGGNRLTGGLATQATMATMQKRASVRVLAQDAVLVTPVTTRSKPVTTSSLKGTHTKNVPVDEVVIAVDPSEVAPIHEAMATDIDVMCVARSGLPDDPGSESITPGSDPLSEVKIVDSLIGSKRESVVLPLSNYQAPSGHNRPAMPARRRGPSPGRRDIAD